MKLSVFIPFVSCSLLLISTHAFAQQIISGSFEPAMGLTPCKDLDVKVYNHNMGGNWSAGTATDMKIADNTCGLGNPITGKYFGVLKYAPPSDGNIIIFKLDKPLTVGKTVSFTVNYKIPSSSMSVTGGLRFGYGSDSTHADSVAGVSKNIIGTAWVKDTFTITPKIAMQYVWVEVSALGGDPFEVHIDDVKMLTTTTDVNSITANNAIRLSPNPFTDKAVLTIDENVSLPYNVFVYDITGRVVLSKNALSDNSVTIDRSSLQTGMYMLKVVDNEQHVYTAKLSVQ